MSRAPLPHAVLRTALRLSCAFALLATCIAAASRNAAAGSLSEAKELRRLSDAVPVTPNMPVQVLDEQLRLSFDDAGRLTTSTRLVYRLNSTDRTEDWARAAVRWSPWYQARPLLEAQVLTSDGVLHALDPATMSESPIESSEPDMYLDDRELEAPLPTIAKGSIVEETHVIRDTALTLDAGRTMRFRIGRNVPVAAERFVVELPENMPFQHRIERYGDVSIERTRESGRLRVVFSMDHAPPQDGFEPGMPSDIPREPAIVFSTGTTWERVASRYRELAESRLAADPGRAAIAALAAEVRAAAGGKAARAELASLAVRRLHARVRYTGVELGDASIVPTPPSVTLERGYGDCKDKSLLLVALLRELKIPAELSLLSAGPGLDVLPEMPGWGVFDHAIVHAPGSPELWMDATDEARRVGQLPFGDQGRWTLPVASGAKALVRLPSSKSTDNRLVETREFVLSDGGMHRVVETTEATGGPEADYRSAYGEMARDKLQSSMESYAQSAYLAKGKVTATTSDPQDFSKPFQLRVTAEDARRGYVTMSTAGVFIPRLAMFSRLPNVLVEFEADSLGDPSYTGTRKADLLLPDPDLVEWRYRIVPPPGFAPDDLPKTADVELGPTRYHQEFHAEANGVVTATLRFDPSTDRMSAAEVNTFRRTYRDLLGEDMPHVAFHHEGVALVTAGRLKEGVSRLRAEVTAAPDRAITHERLADALKQAGLGEAAREEARRATELEPDSFRAWRHLADVLSCDLLGRLHGRGYDRAGAIAACRKAVELAPEDAEQRGALAIALEFDEAGERYTTGADVDSAIRLYQGLTASELTDMGLPVNLPAALEAAKRFEELEKWSRSSNDETAINYRMTAIAALRGATAAIEEVQRSGLNDAARGQALYNCAMKMLGMQRYADASRLLQASARGRENASSLLAQAEMLGKLKPYSPTADYAADPRSLLRRVFAVLTDEQQGMAAMYPMMSAHNRAGADSTRLAATVGPMTRQMRKAFKSTGLPGKTLMDLMVARLDLRVEGDSLHGARVRGVVPGATSSMTMYQAYEQGRWALVDFGSTGTHGQMGYESAAALARGDTLGARQWLRWMREDAPLRADTSAFTTFMDAARNPDAAHIRLAAAALMAVEDSTCAREAIEWIRGTAPAAWTPEEWRALLQVRGQAFRTSEQWDSALVVARELKRLDAASAFGFELECASLNALHDGDGERACVAERLARLPSDVAGLRRGLFLASEAGDRATARRYGQRLDAMQELAPSDLNNWAWTDVVADAVTDTTQERVHRATLAAGTATVGQMNTQAVVYTALDRLSEAREVMLEGLEASGLEEPDNRTWYVVGRMAERYGLTDAARKAYERASVPAQATAGGSDSIARLAQARVAKMGGGGAATGGGGKKR